MKVYTKTPKGIEELVSRRPTLLPQWSSALLLVDSRRSVADLHELLRRIGAPLDTLEGLEKGGYISARELPDLAVRASAPAPQAAVSKPAETADPALVAFKTVYEHLSKNAKEHLGLFKGLQFQLAIERADTVNELRELVKPIGDAIAKSQGLDAANQFVRNSEQMVRTLLKDAHTFALASAKFRDSIISGYQAESQRD